MKTYAGKLAVISLVVAAILVGLVAEGEAGLFRNRGRLLGRFGGRGACLSCQPAAKQKARAACACNPCQCTPESDCGAACKTAAACKDCVTPEAKAAQASADKRNAERNERYDRALYIFSLVNREHTHVVAAINKLRADPEKMAKFRTEVQARYGVSIDSVADLLKLLLEHKDEIIILILQILSLL